MGRTIPSWRIAMEEEMKRWKRFQDVPRIEEREIFEDMTDECRRYASAAGAACFPTKYEPMFLSIIFAHHKALKQLREKIDQLTTSTDSGKQD